MAKNGLFWDLGQKSFKIDTKLGDFGPGMAYLGGELLRWMKKVIPPLELDYLAIFC